MDRNLTAFLEVARRENLTLAADSLGLTQPSVTKRIAMLEEEVGAVLFTRQRRGMTLTPAGQVYFAQAQRIEARYASAKEEVAAVGEAGLSILRVGAGPLFHLAYIAPIFTALKSRFPSIRLDLVADANVRTIPMLKDHRLDVVFGAIDRLGVDDSIHLETMTWIEHGIVLRPDDPAASNSKVDPWALSEKKWVLYTEDHEAERAIGSYYLASVGNAPSVDIRTTSFMTGLQLVTQGDFVMSAPLQLAAIIEKEGLVIRPAVHGSPRREAGAHLRKSTLGFGVVQALLDEIRKAPVPDA